MLSNRGNPTTHQHNFLQNSNRILWKSSTSTYIQNISNIWFNFINHHSMKITKWLIDYLGDISKSNWYLFRTIWCNKNLGSSLPITATCSSSSLASTLSFYSYRHKKKTNYEVFREFRGQGFLTLIPIVIVSITIHNEGSYNSWV